MTNVALAVIQPARDFESDADRALAEDLATRIEGEVRFGRHDRMLYATDASLYQVEPIGVALPRTLDDLERIVEFARDRKLALLPRGGGTSLAGQCVSRALVVDTSKFLRRVIDIDAANQRCTVEPGVVLDQLNAELAPLGRMFAADVATSAHATIGGMVGNNSAGARSILYGRTIENLLSVEAILLDGTVLDLHEAAAERDDRVRALTQRISEIILPIAGEIEARYPKTTRNSGGYMLDVLLRGYKESSPGAFDRVNLAHLICGSEGTLAMIRTATLKLVETPQSKALAVIAYDSVEAALEQLTALLELRPAAVELLDDVVLDMARENAQCRRLVRIMPRPRGGEAGALLYVEFYTDGSRDLEAAEVELRAVAGDAPIIWLTDAASMAQAWLLRKSGEPLLHAVPGRRKPLTFIEDTAVPPQKLAAFVRDFRSIVERHGTRAAYYAHASVGCLHIRPLIDIKDAADRQRMLEISRQVCDLVRDYGGAVSGEHGDGRARGHLLEQFYGSTIVDAFRRIKHLFDPENRMNPGNIVEPVAMDESLRVRPQMRSIEVPDIDTFFEYEHGFGEAVELCNGAGVCRRRSGGAMCPSYRATLDERHATRGRGNALRLAITGQLGETGRPRWNDRETIETLDLCLSCKACKSECPSNVDIARLKAEYTAQRYRETGAPLSARIIGDIRRLNRLGSRMPGVANWMAKRRLVRRMINRIADIDPRRTLPRLERSIFADHRARKPRRERDGGRPRILLFADCFSAYNEPRIARATIRVFEQFGYDVIVPDCGCCARAAISVGLLPRAQRMAAATARTLLGAIETHQPRAVIGLEPSCVSAIKDDWLSLKLDLPRESLQRIADMTCLAEEFFDREWDAHPQRPQFEPCGSTVLLHGHCHQKALWGVESSSAALKRALGEQLVVLDTGCCGMAGSFGYSPSRFDLSMKIGELSLFDPIRASPDAVIAAPGTSCRHQIHDALNRDSRHPMEILDTLLASETSSRH